ncbi:hypothetical protein [Lysinibacillus sp. BPa_S21]|uniref:hypothetical protein n=1 Tax=Lysinibacillus sp. BPa_S21 TaxID=2932478 RepID=UPI002012F59F|nr:hypothetical protein [Lysinibacillus sp. BPa_S21]MCL1696380.1 hypothetical protein [Lysinibacillus sp. BPa_S21]
MKELHYNPTEVQELVFKDKEGISNYIHVSIEEMDYMMKLAIKYQQLHETWFKGIENEEPTIIFLRKCKEIIEEVNPEYRKAMA